MQIKLSLNHTMYQPLQLTESSVDELKQLAFDFIQSMKNDSRYSLDTTLYKILSIVFGNVVCSETKTKLLDALQIVRSISNCPVNIWESNGKTQTCVNSSLADLLVKTLDDDYHTVIADCKHLDGDRCKLGNKFLEKTTKHKFFCSFHMYDSLSVHLVLACIHNGLWTISKNNSDYIVLACLFGLYHDIGKPLTVETYEHRKSTITGFPAHAEVGAMLFQAVYSPDMDKFITKEDYFAVSQAILRHMCGYHGDQNESNSYKRALLLFESEKVRHLLTINRIGDHFGKLSEDSVINLEQKMDDLDLNKEQSEHFLNEQTLFETYMNTNHTSIEDLLQTYKNKSGSTIDAKFAIYLIGTSGAGKTYFMKKLLALFPNHASYVSRDECTSSVCVKINRRLEGEDYVNMYKIYEIGKALSHYSRRIERKNVLTEADRIAIKSLRIDLVKAQEHWNIYIKDKINCESIDLHDLESDTIPDISEQVNTLYKNRISDALKSKPIVILDTFMNCFPMAVEVNTPSIMSKCFRVHVHIQSYIERTSSTISSNIENQLKVSGAYGLNDPLHPDSLRNGNHRKAFASLSAEISTNGCLPKSTFTSNFRPHIVYVCTRTETGDHGYQNTLDSLVKLITTESQDKIEQTTVLRLDDSVSEEVDDEFGVDPLTKDMNIVEFYKHLMNVYSDDKKMIREFLRTLGSDHGLSFMTNVFLEKSFKNEDSEQELLEHCEKLSLLSKEWNESGIINEFFETDQLTSNEVERFEMSQYVVTLKYFEQYGARFWKNVWAKEMRGTNLFTNYKTGDVRLLSYKLPRGAEVVTGMVTKSSFDTQDVKHGKIKILDDEQIDTCVRLNCDLENSDRSSIRLHLTSKADGSLLIVNVYTNEALKIMVPLVRYFGSDYAKLWMKQSLELTNGKRLLIPATQGTFIESGFMAPYMVSSILIGSNIVSRETLTQMYSDGKTYIDAWAKFGTEWMNKFLKFEFFDSLTDTHTFSFEAVCKNRCGLFGDNPHIELACSYDRDRLVFLGVSLADKRFYIPHSIYSRLSKIPFEQPLWWDLTEASQVNDMIQSVSDMILGTMNKKQFLTKFRPSNSEFLCEDLNKIDELISDSIIDFEGWVVMKFASLKITDLDHLAVVKELNIPLTIYSKIKTEPYYRSHKFHTENIPYLIKLADTAGDIFPLASKIAGICREGTLVTRLRTIGKLTMNLLNFADPNNKIIPILHKAYNLTLADAESRLAKGENVKLSKNPLTGFEKRPFDVQCRMALNFKGFDFGELMVPIYLELFPEIDPNTPDLNNVFNSLTLTLQPWTPGYEERIKDLNPQSTSVQGLITACIGSSVM